MLVSIVAFLSAHIIPYVNLARGKKRGDRKGWLVAGVVLAGMETTLCALLGHTLRASYPEGVVIRGPWFAAQTVLAGLGVSLNAAILIISWNAKRHQVSGDDINNKTEQQITNA